MKVKVIKEHNGIPDGSVIHVEKELKNDYILRNHRKININSMIDMKKNTISSYCKF